MKLFNRLSPRGSIRRRLSVGTTLLILLLVLTMGGVSTFALYRNSLAQIDQQLRTASTRTASYQEGLSAASPDAIPALPAEKTDHHTDKPNPQADKPHEHQDDPGRLPKGIRTPGLRDGTLVLTKRQDAVQAAVITPQGSFQALQVSQANALLNEVKNQRVSQIQSVHIPGLGRYRVLLTQKDNQQTLLLGSSLEPTDDLVKTFILWELILGVAAAVLAGVAASWLVKRNLAPLTEVTEAAHQVTEMDLSTGQVDLQVRVPVSDPQTEAGQVAQALNTLLGHVDESLTARAQSEAHLREFVADASHELRTPLASISGYAQLLERHQSQWPQDAQNHLSRIRSEGARMQRLVDQLLLLARLDAGRELQFSEVDLLALCADALADAQAAGPDHEWDFDLDLDPEGPLPLVSGDEDRLRQVLANLLTNARVHTPAGTSVRLGLRVLAAEPSSDGPASVGPDSARTLFSGPRVQVTVQDSGPGIPAAQLERVFERFSRSDQAASRPSGSTGLGLSIVQAIVQAHGGQVMVSSIEAKAAGSATAGSTTADSTTADSETVENSGTTFTVVLPLLVD
ncbi:hypothetical protein BSR29_01235 [Boudabousia liubingyangii]|uniref:histidine kinase n=1 Tax=Boudabousia liubingyangii TaxID=1921764 RepID=A0A1Q5PPU2_9ACTO|nr:HAMP domain-containing sensor histidine kinase [Boudabousia liubingyangii]OKL49611.1 hypothetical protein BSR29_01235 [Boudabousia liubingyangii]